MSPASSLFSYARGRRNQQSSFGFLMPFLAKKTLWTTISASHFLHIFLIGFPGVGVKSLISSLSQTLFHFPQSHFAQISKGRVPSRKSQLTPIFSEPFTIVLPLTMHINVVQFFSRTIPPFSHVVFISVSSCKTSS